jgi:hypothetical protein
MIPYRQPIREGQSGRDVTAVKRAMIAMHVAEAGGMVSRGIHASFAGHSFVTCIRNVQRAHKIRQDGVYGPATHAIIAPHFNTYQRWLYRTAKIRQPVTVPPVPPNAQAAAQKLLELHAQGKYRDDRGGSELAQIQRTARGEAVWSPLGYYVHLDERVLQAICWLIEDKGFKIGTFALTTDHDVDTPLGHSGGHCVDISSIDGISVTAPISSSKPKVIAVLKALHAAPAHLQPWQLISGGCANILVADCEALTIPDAAYYGAETMLEHTNHVHLGYE